MSEPAAIYEIPPDDRVRVRRHPEWGTGEVLSVSQTLGVYQANFRRHQVHTERFLLGPRERMFYDRISEYLREGYDAAGIGEARTTRKQRAIGFVMAIFQKIMS